MDIGDTLISPLTEKSFLDELYINPQGNKFDDHPLPYKGGIFSVGQFRAIPFPMESLPDAEADDNQLDPSCCWCMRNQVVSFIEL